MPSCRSTPGRENLSGCIQRESWRRKTAKGRRNPRVKQIRERGRMWAVVGQATTPRAFPAALLVRCWGVGIPNLGGLPLPAKEAPRRRSPLPLFFSHFSVGSSPRRLGFISSLCFLNLFPSLGLSPPLLFLPWRRRLGERRRHLPCLRPALSRRRPHLPGLPAPSLSFCCARRSTPIPNKTISVFGSDPV